MGKDGTLRDFLVEREKVTGVRDERLDRGKIPQACRLIWEMFLVLHHRRSPSFFGLSLLSISDIEAYTRMVGVELTPWELETLLELDQKVVTILLEKRKGV